MCQWNSTVTVIFYFHSSTSIYCRSKRKLNQLDRVNIMFNMTLSFNFWHRYQFWSKVLHHFGEERLVHVLYTHGHFFLELDDVSWWVLAENLFLQHFLNKLINTTNYHNIIWRFLWKCYWKHSTVCDKLGPHLCPIPYKRKKCFTMKDFSAVVSTMSVKNNLK